MAQARRLKSLIQRLGPLCLILAAMKLLLISGYLEPLFSKSRNVQVAKDLTPKPDHGTDVTRAETTKNGRSRSSVYYNRNVSGHETGVARDRFSIESSGTDTTGAETSKDARPEASPKYLNIKGHEHEIGRDGLDPVNVLNASRVTPASKVRETVDDHRMFLKGFGSVIQWRCSEKGARQEIQALCRLYKNGVVTGDLCSPLCDSEQVKFTRCTTFSYQKRESRDLILRYTNALAKFRVFNDSDALKVVWGQGTEQDLLHVQYASAVWRSLSLLVPQPEYLLAKAFEKKRIFPKIYSSCGHYYIQEFCPSKYTVHWFQRWKKSPWGKSSWRERVQYSLDLLEFLQRIESDLPDPLLLCDVHPNNFGVCGTGSLRVIDSDKLFFNTSYPQLKTGRCWNDSQCRPFNVRCPGTCSKQGKCVMKNNINLEYTCRGMFMDRLLMEKNNLPSDGRGHLLEDPPLGVAADLNHLLHECEFLTERSHHDPETRHRVLDKLKVVLNRSLLHP
ncbi:hypothetical protein BaRGS_00026242 [Batillaria attramentaria]|uniref:Uncharacterized protein n=1 Tax=Batillaria attramentaria TaxID=370345 RepID=A0ABD0K6E2_9CAEN